MLTPVMMPVTAPVLTFWPRGDQGDQTPPPLSARTR